MFFNFFFTASDCHHMFAKPNGQGRSIEQIKREYREVFFKKYDQFIFFEEPGSCVFKTAPHNVL
jgi:hypothetical protein